MVQQNSYIQQPTLNLDASKAAMIKFFMENPDPHNIDLTFYHAYTPQQVLTDEIQQIYKMRDYIKPNSNILTLLGTGDAPLFFKLFGAKYVLTTDISCHSHLIHSLKVAAIQAFQSTEYYYNFLRNLQQFAPDVHKIPDIHQIVPRLSANQREYIIRAHATNFPFCVPNEPYTLYKLSQSDYTNLRNLVKEPLPFIWTNITELDRKLGDDKFDLVYYSNALDFLQLSNAERVLTGTKRHMNDNGVLCLTIQHKYFEKLSALCSFVFRQPDWNVNVFCSENKKSFNHVIIQRKSR